VSDETCATLRKEVAIPAYRSSQLEKDHTQGSEDGVREYTNSLASYTPKRRATRSNAVKAESLRSHHEHGEFSEESAGGNEGSPCSSRRRSSGKP